GLIRDRRNEARMRVTERAHRDPAEHVDVALAVGVPQHGALAARDDDRSLSIVRVEILLTELRELALSAHGRVHIALCVMWETQPPWTVIENVVGQALA